MEVDATIANAFNRIQLIMAIKVILINLLCLYINLELLIPNSPPNTLP